MSAQRGGFIMESPTLEQIASRAGDLPSLPTIALKIIEMVGDSRTSAGDLQRVIMSDQALAARVLKIANSALFNTRSEITTISHAVVVLGFTTLRSVVMTSSIHRVFSDGTRRGGSLSDAVLWEHSLAVAIASREIARWTEAISPEEAFIAGLLHDIGKLVLSKNLETRYVEVLNEVIRGDATFIDAENRLLGFNHAHLGALVARKWKLPHSVANAILYHHNPGMAPADVKHCAVVSLANEMIVTAGIGLEKRAEGDWSEFEAVRLLGTTAAVAREIQDKACALFSAERQSLLA